ncbi:MAG: SRPBCC domain-containing protein [Pseudomonadota bacterium]
MNKGRVVEEAAILFERILPAPREKAWIFLTETARLTEWYGEGLIEPREGGKVALMGGHIRGVVTGWRPTQFLAYTWNVFSPGETISAWPVSYLEFALVPEGTSTKLTLTHRPIPKAVQPQTMMGWHTFLDMVDAAARGESVAPRDTIMKKNAAIYGVDLDNLKR